ncbi:MAG TPA: M1 family aminopeptidase [Bryobacteraceae bacterium]|nr:M1 family aminopeptidase [Bryobacteraceae bacterium]
MRAVLPFILCVPVFAIPPARPYDVDHYEARIEIDLAVQRLHVQETIELHSIVDGLDAIELDAGSLAVSAVVEDFANQPFERQGDLLTVRPVKPVRIGEQRKFTIRYNAGPAPGLLFFDDQVWAAYFTSSWLVCDERPEDRATLQLAIHDNKGMRVAASGREMPVFMSGPNVVWTWKEDRELPPFVFGFAAGKFAESSVREDKTQLRFLGPPSAAKNLPTIFHETGSAFRFLVEKSGQAYLARTYTQVLLKNGPEQEAAELTLLPEKYGQTLLSHPDDLWLMVHELAHQWYGIGIATRDWSDFWLSEGMASFLADVYLGEKFGAERYTKEIEAAHQNYEKMKADGKDRPLSFHGWNKPNEAGGRLPYEKGAWVLHQLRQQMGDDAFWRGLRVYTKDNWGKQVTSKDFEKSMEAVTDTPLADFFQTWVYR